MLELNVWVVYDADGNYECHTAGPEEAMERYSDEIGGHAVTRCVKVKLAAPEPIPVELAGTVPAEKADRIALTVS